MSNRWSKLRGSDKSHSRRGSASAHFSFAVVVLCALPQARHKAPQLQEIFPDCAVGDHSPSFSRNVCEFGGHWCARQTHKHFSPFFICFGVFGGHARQRHQNIYELDDAEQGHYNEGEEKLRERKSFSVF